MATYSSTKWYRAVNQAARPCYQCGQTIAEGAPAWRKGGTFKHAGECPRPADYAERSARFLDAALKGARS